MITDKLGDPENTPDAWVDVTDADDALLLKCGDPYYAYCNGLPLPMAAKLGDAEALEHLTNLKRVNAGYLSDIDEHAFYNIRPAELQVTVPMAKLLEMQRLLGTATVFYVVETGEVISLKRGWDFEWVNITDVDGRYSILQSSTIQYLIRDGFTVLYYSPFNGGLTKIGRDMRGHETYDYVLPAHESYYSVNPFFGEMEYQPPKIADVVGNLATMLRNYHPTNGSVQEDN